MTTDLGTASTDTMEMASWLPQARAFAAAAIHTPSGEDIMSPAACPEREIFTTIPPEIRNRIYELVMPAPDPETEVDLLTAEPLSKALLLTCRQVYSEAKSMYRAAYRKFWSKTKFELCVNCIDERPMLRNALASFMDRTGDEDVVAVTTLRIYEEGNLDLTMMGNTWYGQDFCASRVREMVVFPPAKADVLSAAGCRIHYMGPPVSSTGVCVEDLNSAQKNEVFKLTGKEGLTKGEIIAVMEEMTGWMQEGHHIWTRD